MGDFKEDEVIINFKGYYIKFEYIDDMAEAVWVSEDMKDWLMATAEDLRDIFVDEIQNDLLWEELE